MNESKITIVIPTIGNYKILKRAIDSVLLQTHKNIEIIIVIDGINEETKREINSLGDKRIKIFETIKKVGGGAARNLGITNASGEWIALLDDDDEWNPKKLEIQFQKAKKYQNHDNYFSFTALKTVGGKSNLILPRKKWKYQYDVSEYLFRPFFGRTGGYIQTSTIFASRSFFLSNMFDETLPKHQDWDWIINSMKYSDLIIDFIDIPLTYYHQENITSVGKINRWAFSEKWIHSKNELVNKKTIDFFMLLMVIPGIFEDDTLKKSQKINEIKRIMQSLSLESKFSIKYIVIICQFIQLKVIE